MENGMPKLSLAFAAVLTMGLCFAQSGACAQTAEDVAPLAAEPPEGAEEPEAPVEDIGHPGAGGLLENDPDAGGIIENDSRAGGRIEMLPDECAGMPFDEGAETPPDEGAKTPDEGMPPDENAETPPDERCEQLLNGM
jgi:hypothetical protein